MGISVKCPHCNVKMTVPEKFAGAKTKCPACGGSLTIPGEKAAAQPEQKKVDAELTNWYRTMTGEGDPSQKTSLDELHRDTDVEMSEVVTRWDENAQDDDEESNGSVSASRRAPAPKRSSRSSARSKRRGSGRPASRRRPVSADDSSSSSKFLMLGGAGAVLVVIIIVVVAFGMGGDEGSSPTTEPVNSAGTANTDTSGGNGGTSTTDGVTPEQTPTPTPEPTKTLSEEEEAQRNLRYANDAFNRRDYRGASDYFAKYLEFDSKNEEVWLKLIECYQQLGMQEKMVETLNGALEALGTSSELLRMKAELLMEQEKYDEAFAAYDKVIPGLQGEELRMLLEELYNMAVAVGAALGSKPYLDKAWGYLQKLKPHIDEAVFEEYKASLKFEYENAGLAAPF